MLFLSKQIGVFLKNQCYDLHNLALFRVKKRPFFGEYNSKFVTSVPGESDFGFVIDLRVFGALKKTVIAE
jgi:hypothetical protein